MTKKQSAGILLYRMRDEIEVLLVHPGGPFWVKKDVGAWSLPKGEFAKGDTALVTAKREFEKEIGQPLPAGDLLPLLPVKQADGKVIYAWALEGDIDIAQLKSNTFTMEWPPKSGKLQAFPEVDRAEWFTMSIAKSKIIPGQADLLDELRERIRDITKGE